MEKGNEKEIMDEGINEIVSTLGEEEKPKVNSVYENFLQELSSARQKVKLKTGVYEELASFARVVEVDIPVLLDKKSHGKDVVRILSGFRAQHNNTSGQCIGGVRFYPSLRIEEIKGLAALMTIKTTLLNMPFGGSCGGVAVETKALTKNEVERLSRGYIKKVARFVGEKDDVIVPDRGVDSRVIGFMIDEFKRIARDKNAELSFCGKPYHDGGLRFAQEPVATGAFMLLESCLKAKEVAEIPGLHEHEDIIKKRIEEKSVAIHGFGNVASNLANMLCNAGYRVIAVCDANGGIASSKGINPADVVRWKRAHGTLKGLGKTVNIATEQLLQIKADILVLASIENQITESNAGSVKADIVIEIANSAITPEAHDILYSLGKTVIPDVIANTGGLILNYYELQNNLGKAEGEPEKFLKDTITKTFNYLSKVARENSVNLKKAAFIIALNRLNQTIK